MEKKDSIFAGLNPAPAPAHTPLHAPTPLQAPTPLHTPTPLRAPTPFSSPAPQPAAPQPAAPHQTPASRPVAPDQDAAALKNKIEAMEKNILTQLEKKISEQLKAAVPPPPPPGARRPADANSSELMARIGELDKRLEEFARNAMTSSVQMKNIEESKIGTRREIEDLLKVVREQQKYTEMDREMHDQLAKSWGRAEELEKRLIDFCSAVLTKQERAAPEPSRPDYEARILDDSRIEAMVTRLELHMQSVEKKLSTQENSIGVGSDFKKEIMNELSRTREEALALSREQTIFFKTMLEDQLKSRLEMIQMELGRSRRESASEMELFKKEFAGHMSQMRETVDKLVKERLDDIRNSVTAELDRSRKETCAEMESFAKEFAGHMEDMSPMLEDFKRAMRENRIRTDGVEEALAKNTADTSAMLQKHFEKTGEAFARQEEKFLLQVEDRNRRQVEALNTKYADALSNAVILDFIGAAADSSVKKLAQLEGTLSDFLGQVDKEQLSSVLGVSGMRFRKNFEALENMLAGIKAEADAFDQVKRDIKDRVKDIFGRGQA